MTIAPPTQQLNLLHILPSWHITKNAQARNAYGAVAQEIVCAALALTPIPINGNYDCCFDAHSGDTYYEIKSVRRCGGKVVVYDWRMRKEREAEVTLHYAILCHAVRRSDGRNLPSEFIDGGLELLVIDAGVVHDVAARQPLQRLQRDDGTRSGYNRIGYRDGYRNVPVATLETLCGYRDTLFFNYAGLEGSLTRATPNPF